MSINLIDNTKATVLDLIAAQPAADSRAETPRAQSVERESGRGFDELLRDAKPKAEPVEQDRVASADDVVVTDDASRGDADAGDVENSRASDTSDGRESSVSDGEQGDTQEASDQADDASAEVSSDEQTQDPTQSIESETQSAQSLAAELALAQLANVQNPADTSSSLGTQKAEAAAAQQAQAALAQASADASAKANAQSNAVQLQAATTQASQQSLQLGAQAETNSGDTKGEAQAGSQVTTASTQAGNTAAANAVFTLPDQAAGEGRLPTSLTGTVQQADGTKSAQAQLQAVNTQQDNDSLNTSRIARGLANAVQQKGGAVTLRLTPAEMGTVRIQMNITGTNVSASFHAETASAQTLLTQQMGQLRSALETQGMNVERLSVQPLAATASSQSSSQSNNDGQQNPNQAQQQSAGDGRSRGQYSGDNPGGQSSGQDDGQGASANGNGPRGFFDQLADVADQAA